MALVVVIRHRRLRDWVAPRPSQALASSSTSPPLEAEVKTAADIGREREQALERALERLRAGFDSVGRRALRDNSEVFLQLAREHLGQHQQRRRARFAEREKAIEAMLGPATRSADPDPAADRRIEKERAETFGALRIPLRPSRSGSRRCSRKPAPS